jgi:7,8-dihydropterin-6-yl-methyl-4-(beta-D-ribofuranosyl)aminobenzene 5'-phosphate synthase
MSVETNQPPALAVVDSLAVDVLTDNVSDTYVSKTSFAVSEFANIVLGGATEISGETLLAANLGYGLRLRSKIGARQHTMLFDTGTEGAVFIRNCRNLGLDLGTIEEIAITHGHWDHMGALPAAIDAIVKRRGRNAVTVHVNPGMFNERGVLLKSGTIFPAARVPTPAQMEERGAKVVNDGKARLLLDSHFYYSGEIPRVSSFETGREDHLCRKDNSEDWRPDPYLMDERMLVANVRDLGLVVFSACSHAGIVNVCTEVRRLFPDTPIHAVMGGLHLGGVMEHLIPQTVEALKPFDIRNLITGHCTGGRCMRWPTPMASGSASRRSAPATRSTPRHQRPPRDRRHLRRPASRRKSAGDAGDGLSGQRQDHAREPHPVEPRRCEGRGAGERAGRHRHRQRPDCRGRRRHDRAQQRLHLLLDQQRPSGQHRARAGAARSGRPYPGRDHGRRRSAAGGADLPAPGVP